MRKKFFSYYQYLFISLLAGLFIWPTLTQQVVIERKKIIKHVGFRLLEEQIGIYIKENYSQEFLK